MAYDLVCLSHLRWEFVHQRPQHLLSLCAKDRSVFFVEEPVFGEERARLALSHPAPGVTVVRPHLPEGLTLRQQEAMQRDLLAQLFHESEIVDYVLWYYTPMALGFTCHLAPLASVYDCMDELALFHGAPRVLRERERELFRRVDLVFTGGRSLYEAKRDRHRNVYAFPSSVDAAHFGRARDMLPEPDDQRHIPHPRIGFYGVIDERLDLDLLDGIADLRPDWHLAMIGPVVKIDAVDLPRRPNIHYLGARSYEELPAHLAGWDAAIMPFAHNDSTRFISPTKTLEYLAAGKPVVSTSIRDVVDPYGRRGLVHIADTPRDFVGAIERALAGATAGWLRGVDAYLATTSWRRTWRQMEALIDAVVETRRERVLSLPTPLVAHALEPMRPAKGRGGRLVAFSPAGAQPALTAIAGEEAE